MNTNTGITQIETDSGIAEVSLDRPNYELKGQGSVSTEVSNNEIIVNRSVTQSGNLLNFGMTYDDVTGEFKIVSSDGTNLSPANTSTVRFQGSQAGLNQLVNTSYNYRFFDVNGSSNLTDKLFGVPSGTPWILPAPFFIYSILDTSNEIMMGISRIPFLSFAPSSANLSNSIVNASNNEQFNMFILDFHDGSTWNIPDLANIENRVAVRIGQFLMSKPSLDDWQVQALDERAGFNVDLDMFSFRFPTGANGADSGQFYSTDVSNPVIFTTNQAFYRFHNQRFYIEYFMRSEPDTPDEMPLNLHLPFEPEFKNICLGQMSQFDNFFGSFIKSMRDVNKINNTKYIVTTTTLPSSPSDFKISHSLNYFLKVKSDV